MQNFSQYRLIILISILFTVFYNFTFFKNTLNIYPLSENNILHVISLAILLISLNIFIFSLFASKYSTKPLLISLVVISSFTAYFMDTYQVIIDTEMIRNSMQTNLDESLDLFTIKLILYVLLLGIIPSLFIYKVKLKEETFKQAAISKIKYLLFSLIIILVVVFSFNKFYTSFFREHKPLRYNVNPIYWIYSVGNYVNKTYNAGSLELKKIGEDAKIILPNDEVDKKELIILVVGEATRADRFSLNGYKKETNSLLKKEEIINFSNMYSCGTSTAVSVPCMFSIYDKNSYDYKKGLYTENVIDVLHKTKDIKVLWRDNNSSSKGVANRVDYEDFKTPQTNTICDEIECRDEGMIVGLDKYIEKNKGKDILIVLHQMGNHGPAYYKRYPKEFEKFTPVCKTNQLEQCSQEEVSNAYDNAILHTDYFLSEVIKFLKPYQKDYETAMLYMADHGESLGENGLYLHGVPYFMAPDNQIHVASVMWIGDGDIKEDIDVEKLKSYSNRKFSQDNLFHTLLGLFEVETKEYVKELDILNDAKNY